MSELLDRYMEGWTKGDAEMLLGACAEDYVYDDPIDGRFTKADIGAYLESLPEGSLEFADVVSGEIGGLETAWCWYRLNAPTGSAVVSQEGAAVTKVGPDGVHSSKVTYYEREPQIVRGATEAEAA
jgi:hypothetical protein